MTLAIMMRCGGSRAWTCYNSLPTMRRSTTASYSAVTESSAPIVNDAAYDECSMDDIVSLCKRRGFIFPSSEIYNGYAGFYDYGPLGAEMKKNIKDAWWKHFVQKREDVVGLDSSIIHNPTTWKSSGECIVLCCRVALQILDVQVLGMRKSDIWDGQKTCKKTLDKFALQCLTPLQC